MRRPDPRPRRQSGRVSGQCDAGAKLRWGRHEGRGRTRRSRFPLPAAAANQHGIGPGRAISRLRAAGGSTIRHVDGEPAQGGFLVFLAHVGAGLAHRLDRRIQRHEMPTVAAQRQGRRRDRLDRAQPVAFDYRAPGPARAPGRRSCPGDAPARFLPRFQSVPGVPPRTAQSPAAAMALALPTSAWQPASAPLIEALNLTSPPIAAAVSRKSATFDGAAPGQ